MDKKKIDKGIENIPNLVRYGTLKIKSKNIQRALNSDIANFVVEEAQNKTKDKIVDLFAWKKWAGIISNFQIENTIEKIEDDDLNDNFVGVFPSN